MFPSPTHRALFLSTLRTLGVGKLVVSFSGGGDSGDVDDIKAYNAEQTREIPLAETIPWRVEEDRFNQETNEWEEISKEETLSLEKIAKELTLRALQDQGLDWYNNDGGQGSLEINFSTTPPTIQLEVGINYMSTEEHSFDYSEE